MNRVVKTSFWTIVFGLIFLASVVSASAQKASIGPVDSLWEDTAINPHDFTNAYYASNGIVGRAILNRRTGSDGLSTFGNSSNPFHRNIRVMAAIPAYDQSGAMLFWYPLGEIRNDGFTQDKIGWEARLIAELFPIYVFPHMKLETSRLFINTRQAALMDNTWSMTTEKLDMNPVGVRQVFFVAYTEKAFTEEGRDMMNYMSKKNGTGADDTPILSSMEDLRTMMKYELVTTRPGMAKSLPIYAIAPMIADPTSGVIAKDAFLLFATKDGSPLPTESFFSRQFGCVQKTGNWCSE